MEALVVPHRRGDAALIQDFEDFFANQLADVVEFTRAVFDQGITIRAQFGFKTPDALHLSAAVVSGCDVFLTNDQQLTRYTGIRVEVV